MYQQCDMLIITGIAVFSHQVNSTPPIQKEVGSFQLQLLIKDLYARVVPCNKRRASNVKVKNLFNKIFTL